MQWPKEKKKSTDNNLQSITQKCKDKGTRTPLQPGVISGDPERFVVPAQRVTQFDTKDAIKD